MQTLFAEAPYDSLELILVCMCMPRNLSTFFHLLLSGVACLLVEWIYPLSLVTVFPNNLEVLLKRTLPFPEA